MRRIILVVMILSVFLFAGCSEKAAQNPDTQSVGGQKDEHGCMIASGYGWCESKQKCMMMWEEYCAENADQFKVDNFEKCVEAGNPIKESYPRQCKSKEGTTFTEVIYETTNELPEHEAPGI